MPEPTYTDYVELRRSDSAPASPPSEDNVRYYSDPDGALRLLLADGTDDPVAGAGVLPNPTDDGDVLTVVDGEWSGAAGGGSQPVLVQTNGFVKDYDPPGGIDGTDTLIIDTSAQDWQPNTAYSVSAVVLGGGLSPKVERLVGGTSGGIEPTWPASGDTVDDGELRWQGDDYAGEWASGTPYAPGALISAAGAVWSTSGGGTSDSTPPDWASADWGDSVADNDITWSKTGPVTTWDGDTVFECVLPVSQNSPHVPFVLPTVPGSVVFQLNDVLKLTGLSGGSEPDWPVAGLYVIDGDLLWDVDTFAGIASLQISGLKAPAAAKVLSVTVLDPNGSSNLLDLTDELAGYQDSEAANQIDCGGSDFTPGGSSVTSVPYSGEARLVYTDDVGHWLLLPHVS